MVPNGEKAGWAPLYLEMEKMPQKHVRISHQLDHDTSYIQLFLKHQPACYHNIGGMTSNLMLTPCSRVLLEKLTGPQLDLPYAALQNVFWQAFADSLLVICLSSTEGWRQERHDLRHPTHRPAILAERCLHTGRLMLKNDISIMWCCCTTSCHFTLNRRIMECTQLWRLHCKNN
jgi:hypothetical protein